MTTMLGILRRVFSFQDWTQHHPSEPPPGDMLDASFDAQNSRISELEQLVLQIIRSDGALQNDTVHWDSLTADSRAYFEKHLTEKTEKIEKRVFSLMEMAQKAEKEAKRASESAIQTVSRAAVTKTDLEEAERAAAIQFQQLTAKSTQIAQLLTETVETRSDWDDAESSAQAWADSSRLWAEHMPDTLPDNALKVMDITGDHWSSRWWANQAANAFGQLTSLYLGAHPVPPVTNNNGGPIQIGSIYYDTTTDQAYVWDGSQWQSFYGVQRAGIMTLWYLATANQTAFPTSAADLHGKTFTIDATKPEGVDPHVNGVKLMPLAAGSPDGDYTLSGSTITFLRPLRAGDIVGIDILMPVEALGPGAVENWKLSPLTGQDGVKVTFALTCAAGGGPAVTINKSEELIVSLDGVIQEPTVGYSASGSNITFVGAPTADSRIFITWQRSSGGVGIIEDEVTGGHITISATAPPGPLVNDVWIDTA
jgi:hypothetical protein